MKENNVTKEGLQTLYDYADKVLKEKMYSADAQEVIFWTLLTHDLKQKIDNKQ